MPQFSLEHCVERRTGVSKLKKNPLGFDIWRKCPNHHALLPAAPFTAPAGVDIKEPCLPFAVKDV